MRLQRTIKALVSKQLPKKLPWWEGTALWACVAIGITFLVMVVPAGEAARRGMLILAGLFFCLAVLAATRDIASVVVRRWTRVLLCLCVVAGLWYIGAAHGREAGTVPATATCKPGHSACELSCFVENPNSIAVRDVAIAFNAVLPKNTHISGPPDSRISIEKSEVLPVPDPMGKRWEGEKVFTLDFRFGDLLDNLLTSPVAFIHTGFNHMKKLRRATPNG